MITTCHQQSFHLLLSFFRSLDDSGVLERSIERERPSVLKDANWHMVAALVDGIRQVESRLDEGTCDVESLLESLNNSSSVDSNILAQFIDFAQLARSCVNGLNALHSTDSTSEVVQKARSMATSAAGKDGNQTNTVIMGSTQIVADKDLEIMRLKGEIEECRDDLRRDEEIFAEKMKELKKNKKEV